MASYWQKLGLTSDPFTEEGLNYQPYFPSRWQQQLDLLQHLSQTSPMVLLVTGVSGCGKSFFMELLFEQIESTKGVCKINGSSGVTTEIVEELVARHLGMTMTSGAEVSFQQRFIQQIERMKQAKEEFYLVIDGAQKLPKSSLALLVDMAEWQVGETHPLHFILFGGPQLDAIMAEITAQHLGEAMTHTIRLDPFSQDMTREYIAHRLQQCSYDGPFPFSEAQLTQVYQMSNGIPAKINIIAPQVLLENEPRRQRSSSSNQTKAEKTISSWTLPVWGATGCIAVFVIIMFVVFSFRDPVDTPVKEVALHSEAAALPDTQTTEPQTLVTVDKVTSESVETAVQETPEESVTSNAPPEEVIEQTATIESPATEVLPPQPEESITVANDNWVPLLATDHEVKTNAPTASAKTAIKAAAPAAKTKMTGLTDDEKHLMRLPANHYTLQLAASVDLTKLKAFIKSTQMPGQVYFFRTINAGRPWFVATYGNYATKAEAQAAIGKLPTTLLVKQSPWSRGVGNIQAAIKEQH